MLRKGLSYVLAACLWMICAYELMILIVRTVRGTLGEAPFVGHLLTQPSLGDRAAPLAVLLVFGWIFLQVAGLALRIARERSALSKLSAGQLQTVSKRTRAGHRAQLEIEYGRSSPHKLTEALPAAGALDAAALENSYSVLKAYVWTLPVLGFIGTAWGMAHAIRGFSEALQAAVGVDNHGQIEMLTHRLGQFVIPGLANAFSITMLALGASIVAHFWITTLQSWEQEVLDELDRVSVEKLAKLAPAHQPNGLPPGLLPAFLRLISGISEQLESLNDKLDFVDTGDELKKAAAAHVAAAQEIRTAADELKGSVRAPYHITISREERP